MRKDKTRTPTRLCKSHLAILASLVVSCGGSSARASDHGQAQLGEGKDDSFGVNELMENVDHLSGDLLVTGVVRGTATNYPWRCLSLVDLGDFKKHGIACCALTLPVKLYMQWSEELPAMQQVVRVSGTIGREADKLVFMANSIEVLEPGAEAQ